MSILSGRNENPDRGWRPCPVVVCRWRTESRDFEVLPTHFGDGGLDLYMKDGPFAFVIADYRFIPSVKIVTGNSPKHCIRIKGAVRAGAAIAVVARS
jgi:hypothetical protein